MNFTKSHPLATGIVLGAVLGYIFASQFKKVPLVSKLPQV